MTRPVRGGIPFYKVVGFYDSLLMRNHVNRKGLRPALHFFTESRDGLQLFKEGVPFQGREKL